MASEQQRLYSNLSDADKKKFATQLAEDLRAAGLRPMNWLTGAGQGTDEAVVARIGQLVRIIGSDELIDNISDAKGNDGKQILEGGLRHRLVKDYSNLGGNLFPMSGGGDRGGDLINVLNLYGLAGHEGNIWENPMGWLTQGQAAVTSPQEKDARRRGLDPNDAHLGLYGRRVEGRTGGGLYAFDEMPDELGDVHKITGKEGAIPSWWARGLPKEFPTQPPVKPLTPEEFDKIETEGRKNTPPDPVTPVTVPVEPVTEGVKKDALKDTQREIAEQRARALLDAEKAQIEQAGRMKQRRAQLKSGYEGGVEQYDYDRSILKGTRLGDTDSQGKFRLRSPEQMEAREREGQYILSKPMRKAHREGMQAATAARQFAKDIDSGAVERVSQQIQSVTKDLPDTHPMKNAPPEAYERFLRENEGDVFGPSTGALRDTMQTWSQSKADRELATQNALRQSMIGPRPAGPNRKAITSPDMRNTQLQKIPGVKDPKTGLDVVEDPAARDQRQWAEGRGNRRIDKSRKGVPSFRSDYSVKELRDASGNVVGYGTTGRRVTKDEVGAASPDLADFQDKNKNKGGGDFNEWRRKRNAEEDRKKALQAEYAKKIK